MLPVLVLLSMSGCGVTNNLIYTVDIQQGNVLNQKLVDDLRPGMTKRQVNIVLGTPAIASPFHHDRWDYIYFFPTKTRSHCYIWFYCEICRYGL